MKSGLSFAGLICCDQPGCSYEMEFSTTYTGHILDKVCIRIDRLDYHRNEAHPEAVAAENEEAPRG